ncbi:hypothetical protein V5799_022327 [Amblyomma americanum]|uniref:Peptidase M13 C-terminal domain-containing protein n=1 Tax=Amblyomma americanum TaxID=6943 RepID=A0AAQ4FKY4_AMBAM
MYDRYTELLSLDETTGKSAIVKEFEAEAGRLSAEPVREHTPYLTSSDKRGAVVTLLASCAVGIVTYLLVHLKTSLLRTLPDGSRIFCDSFDCREHALHIGITLRSSQLDPCEDFGRFVCAGWQPRYILTRTVIEEATVQWTWKLAAPRSRHENAASSSMADHASAMSSLCVDKGASDQHGSTRRLRAFMKAQGLLWPDDLSDPLPRNSAKPLRSLVNLAVKWRLPLWFDIDLIPSGNERNRAVCLMPSRIAVLWNSLFDHVEFTDPYTKILSKEVFRRNIKPSSWPKGSGGVIHRSIVRELSYAAGLSDVTSWISNVRGVADVVQAFSPRDWADALQSAFNASPPITVEDEVLVSDFKDVKVVGRLFRDHTPRDVMAHVSWWVAQILGSLTNAAVLKAMNMSGTLEKDFHVIFCGLQIESAYNMLLAVADKEQVTAQQRTTVEQFLERVFNKTANLVLQPGLITDDERTALLRTIHGAATIIWPDDRYSSELTRLYTNFATRTQDGFFDAWKAIRQIDSQSFKKHYSSKLRLAIAEIRRATSSSTLTSYNAMLKTVYVSPAALSPPFYYSTGTSAMIFGGLGFLYARESLRLLASAKPLFLSNANDIGSNSSALSYKPMDATLNRPSTCREQGHHLMSDLPALEAAFAAYEMYRNDAEDVRLKDMEKFAPIQVFLITACHTMCETQNATRMSPRCTVAMGNFRPFALAFACPVGSPMNPPEKCDFFS